MFPFNLLIFMLFHHLKDMRILQINFINNNHFIMNMIRYMIILYQYIKYYVINLVRKVSFVL